MEVFYKKICWEKIKIHEDLSLDELIDIVKTGDYPEGEWDCDPSLMEDITIDQNDGMATIEIYNNGKLLWNNVKEKDE